MRRSEGEHKIDSDWHLSMFLLKETAFSWHSAVFSKRASQNEMHLFLWATSPVLSLFKTDFCGVSSEMDLGKIARKTFVILVCSKRAGRGWQTSKTRGDKTRQKKEAKEDKQGTIRPDQTK
jgi:hypothetical protein